MKCVCEEMIKRCGWAESLTFKCPVHGKITVDRRSVVHTAPVVLPNSLPTVPHSPWIPPYYVGDVIPNCYDVNTSHPGKAVGGGVPEPYFPMK